MSCGSSNARYPTSYEYGFPSQGAKIQVVCGIRSHTCRFRSAVSVCLADSPRSDGYSIKQTCILSSVENLSSSK